MSLRGQLLVADPSLVDPNFARTVVYLIDHGAEGALGVILNRVGAHRVGDVLPDWGGAVSPPGRLFEGGPVSTDAAIALARGPRWDRDGFDEIADGIGVLDLHRGPDVSSRSDAELDVGAPVDRADEGSTDAAGDVRVFGGYAGWSAGQLEGELAAGGWIVVGACGADVFCADPDRLWRRVLGRQPGPVRRYAGFADDPTLN